MEGQHPAPHGANGATAQPTRLGRAGWGYESRPRLESGVGVRWMTRYGMLVKQDYPIERIVISTDPSVFLTSIDNFAFGNSTVR